MVRLNLARDFLAAAREAGADVSAVLLPLGLQPTSFDDPDLLVPATLMYDVVENLGNASGDPFIGARLGEKLDLLNWSPMIEAVRNGRTVGDLLLRFSLDANRDASSVEHVMETRGGRCTFAERRVTDSGRLPRHNDAFGAAFLLAILKAATGANWRGADVMVLVCDPAALPTGYLGVRVSQGDSLGFRVAFPAEWLLLEPAAAQERQRAESLSADANIPTDSLPALKHILLTHLPETDLDTARVAEICGLSKRTLARRMSELGTTLKAELDQLRATQAKSALLNGDLSVAQVGASVGYPEPSVFTRAFRRWTGLSPRQYREQARRGSG